MPIIVMLLSKTAVEATKITLPESWNFIFLESSSEEKIIAACQGADCMLVMGSVAKINARILHNIPTIKLIQCTGTGFNHVDIDEAARMGIPVANAPGANAQAVAEFTVGAMIALQRRFIEADQAIKAGNYKAFRDTLLDIGLKGISGSKIGLLGFGNIAQQVAKIALGLGASISYYTPHRRPVAIEDQLKVEYKSFESLLAENDIVSIHVPLNAKTRDMIGQRELDLMPSGSLLINTARGEIVNQYALAEALESRHLAGAAIDTLSPEPPGNDHPLVNLSSSLRGRLLLTPHIAFLTTSGYKKMLEMAFSNMERVLHGKMPEHIVNRSILRLL